MNDFDQSKIDSGGSADRAGGTVRRIVVGVSPSPSGQAALKWAAGAAEAQGATLHLVRVWREIGWFFSMTASEVRELRDSEEADERVLREALAAALVEHSKVRVTSAFVRGDLFDGLRDQAGPNDVLVLGSGPGPTDLIDDWMTSHVRCPVVVVSAGGTVGSAHEWAPSAGAGTC